MKARTFWGAARNAVQFIIYAMIVAMFIVWVALGSMNINKQNQAILDGILKQHDEEIAGIEQLIEDLEDGLTKVIKANSVGDRTIICLLNVEPQDRTDDVTQKCLKAAANGRSTLKEPKPEPGTSSPSTGATGGGTSAPDPSPSPEPKPKPCDKAGKSGKCKPGKGNGP